MSGEGKATLTPKTLQDIAARLTIPAVLLAVMACVARLLGQETLFRLGFALAALVLGVTVMAAARRGRLTWPWLAVTAGSAVLVAEVGGLGNVLGAEVLLAPLLAAGLLQFWFDGAFRHVPRLFVVAYAVFLLVIAASAVRTGDQASIKEVARYAEIGLIALAVYGYAARSSFRFSNVYWLLVAVCLGLTGYRLIVDPGLSQLLALLPLETGEFAYVVALTLPFLAKLRLRYAAPLAIAFGAFAAFSNARISWVAIGIAAITYVLYAQLRRRRDMRRGLGLAILAAMAVLVVSVPTSRDRALGALQLSDQSSNDRVQMAKAALDAFRSHVLGGIGAGEFKDWLLHQQPPATQPPATSPSQVAASAPVSQPPATQPPAVSPSQVSASPATPTGTSLSSATVPPSTATTTPASSAPTYKFVLDIGLLPRDPHSVPLKTAAEVGLIGLIPLLVWLGALVAYPWLGHAGEELALEQLGLRISTGTFIVIALVSPAFGGAERLLYGLYFGLMLLARSGMVKEPTWHRVTSDQSHAS